MKYIIMCGGNYPKWETPRQLLQINKEPIVARTVRLLKESGVDDIAISTNLEGFDKFGVDVIPMEYTSFWASAFYPTKEPCCYIYGDVIFSPSAIKTIVETKTLDIEFFASAPPFHGLYPKNHAEPFAFKVVNQRKFQKCLALLEKYWKAGKVRRCISWELWQIIKDTPLNKIDYTNYTAINDYTCDVDSPEEISFIITRAKQYRIYDYG